MINTCSQEEQIEYSPFVPTMKFSTCPFGSPNLSVKPKFFKLLNEMLSNHFDPILNYLDLVDLSHARLINKLFFSLINDYYQRRLPLEIGLITSHLEANQQVTTLFMKDIDSQIPISKRNWLDFDLASVTKKLASFNRKLITELRGIKNIGKMPKTIYAPFCIIFGMNKKGASSSLSSNMKSEYWKTTAWKIISSPNFLTRITNFDYENLPENDMLDAFIFLNQDELDNEVIKRFSSSLEKMLSWCQAVVSYHILIHPYAYRNDKSQILVGSEEHEFSIQMNELINRFYKFKRFLFNLNIFKIPLGDYVFNLQHSREHQQPKTSCESLLTPKSIGSIFSFLQINQNFKLMSLSKKFYEGFKCGIDDIVFEIIKEIFFFKLQAYEKLSKRIPVIYENNIFSKYFLMLDDILNSDCNSNEQGITYVPFLSKEQLNDIKNIKIESEAVTSIAKVLCVLLNEKVERKADNRGNIKQLYLQRIKVLIINGTLLKLMRNLNKLEMDQTQIKIISEELLKYYSVSKMEEIKKINRGLYQLLVWELYVFELLKEYNPFSFINLEYVNNRYEPEEVEMINYYIEIMNYLRYNLKAKYHFSTSSLGGTTTQSPRYELREMITQLNDFLSSQNITTDILFDNTNSEHSKIAGVYFESKNIIPHSAKPALYESILIEIIATSSSLTDSGGESSRLNTSKNAENKLGTIKEENSINDKAMLSNPLSGYMINNNSSSNKAHMNINPFLKNQRNNTGNPPLNVSFNTSPCTLTDLPSDILIKSVLFYLDVNSLPSFSLINKKANKCVKTHIFIRLHYLNKEKTIIEEESKDIINSINQKRQTFYEEYEMEPPLKEHAYSLVNKMTSEDLVEIKQCFKKYNKTYEIVISPLVLLLGGKAKVGYRPDGTKSVSYFTPAQQIIFKRDFVKRIRELELETIPIDRFHSVENALKNQVFTPEKMKQFSPCLNHLISWFMGVVEYHRVIRKYSLSYYDYEILDENEINFCTQMDNILLWYLKLLRYSTQHCKRFEKSAQTLMSTMQIENEEYQTDGNDNDNDNDNENEIENEDPNLNENLNENINDNGNEGENQNQIEDKP